MDHVSEYTQSFVLFGTSMNLEHVNDTMLYKGSQKHQTVRLGSTKIS